MIILKKVFPSLLALELLAWGAHGNRDLTTSMAMEDFNEHLLSLGTKYWDHNELIYDKKQNM